MKGRILSAGLLLIGLWPGLAMAEWGKPLGGTYDGPEGKPRVVTPSPAELGADERATMAVFERATKSVVFIANTAIQRDPWSFNLFEVPQGSGSGFVWNKQGHIVTNFHVVYGANSVTVTLADRTEYKATLIGADPDHDVAVLQIRAPEETLSPLTVGIVARSARRAKGIGDRESVRPRSHADDRCGECVGANDQVLIEPDD